MYVPAAPVLHESVYRIQFTIPHNYNHMFHAFRDHSFESIHKASMSLPRELCFPHFIRARLRIGTNPTGSGSPNYLRETGSSYVRAREEGYPIEINDGNASLTISYRDRDLGASANDSPSPIMSLNSPLGIIHVLSLLHMKGK